MKIRYNDGPEIELPREVINAIEMIGRRLCRLQAEALPEEAKYWTCFRWNVDANFQIEFSFGGSVEDVTFENEHWPLVTL